MRQKLRQTATSVIICSSVAEGEKGVRNVIMSVVVGRRPLEWSPAEAR